MLLVKWSAYRWLTWGGGGDGEVGRRESGYPTHKPTAPGPVGHPQSLVFPSPSEQLKPTPDTRFARVEAIGGASDAVRAPCRYSPLHPFLSVGRLPQWNSARTHYSTHECVSSGPTQSRTMRHRNIGRRADVPP